MRKKILSIIVTAVMFCVAGCSCGGSASVDVGDNGSGDTNQNTTADNNNETSGNNADNSGNQNSQNNQNNENNQSNQDELAVKVLENIWSKYDEADKFYAYGGDAGNMVEEAPGAFDTSDAEYLSSSLGFPADRVNYIDGCASLVHGLNANTFTSAAYHVIEDDNVETLAADIRTNILNTQFICGIPEMFMIAEVDDDYIVTAFGNSQVVEIFKNNLNKAYDDVDILYEEPIA